MSCSNIDTCGCGHQHSAKCSFYYGDTLSCIGVAYGTDLEQALIDINTAVCALTPSGSITVVNSCDTNIDVTSAVVGQTTTYTVCLSSDITDDIDYSLTNISTLLSCVDQGVFDVTSSTLDITEIPSTGCGRTLNIEYTPSGNTTTFDGIIYNDLNKVGTSGAVGDKVLKSFTTNYDNYNFTEGDEIRFKSNGQIWGEGIIADSVKFEVFDVNSAILLYSEEFTGFDKTNKQSWRLNGDITYTDITSGEVAINIDFFANSLQNGDLSTLTRVSQIVVNSIFNIADFTNLRLRLVYNHQGTSGATNNFARQLLVEIRKKI